MILISFTQSIYESEWSIFFKEQLFVANSAIKGVHKTTHLHRLIALRG